jgi:putative inorganic carbon (hco3(-)) transporter
VLFFFVLLYLAALYVRPGELFSSFQDLPLVDYLSGGALVVASATIMVSPRKFWDQPHDKFFLAYFLMVVVSNPLNGWVGGGEEAFWLFLPVAFCYFLMRAGVRTVGQIKWCTRALVVLNIFLAVNALLPIYAPDIAGVRAMETREGVRIQGTGIFNDPNDLGMTLVMVLPFVLSTVTGRGIGFLSRVAAAAGLVVIMVACYYTNSRGTMLGLGVVFTIYAYRRFGLIFASTIAGAALIGIVAFGPSRMSNVSADDASAQGRIQAWAAGYDMLQRSPIWGVGWQRFDDLHFRVAHNSFVHAMAELGVLGALFFVGMYYWYFTGLRPAGVGAAQAPADPGKMPTPAGGRLTAGRPIAKKRTAFTMPDRLARDLSDAGIGLLTAMCFLSRQYTVTAFIPLALVASFASATDAEQNRGPERFMRSALSIPALTCAGIIGFYLVSRVLVQW